MFDAAIASAQPAVCIPPHLPDSPRGRLIVVGAGKASAAMARVVEEHWQGPLSGLVVTRYGYAVPCKHIEIVEAAHFYGGVVFHDVINAKHARKAAGQG